MLACESPGGLTMSGDVNDGKLFIHDIVLSQRQTVKRTTGMLQASCKSIEALAITFGLCDFNLQDQTLLFLYYAYTDSCDNDAVQGFADLFFATGKNWLRWIFCDNLQRWPPSGLEQHQ
jgi:hypothetical protein